MSASGDSELSVLLSQEEGLEPGVIHAATQPRLTVAVGTASVLNHRHDVAEGLVVDIAYPCKLAQLGLLPQQITGELLLIGGGDVIGYSPGHGLLGPLKPFAPKGLNLSCQQSLACGRFALVLPQTLLDVFAGQTQVIGWDGLP